MHATCGESVIGIFNRTKHIIEYWIGIKFMLTTVHSMNNHWHFRGLLCVGVCAFRCHLSWDKDAQSKREKSGRGRKVETEGKDKDRDRDRENNTPLNYIKTVHQIARNLEGSHRNQTESKCHWQCECAWMWMIVNAKQNHKTIFQKWTKMNGKNIYSIEMANFIIFNANRQTIGAHIFMVNINNFTTKSIMFEWYFNMETQAASTITTSTVSGCAATLRWSSIFATM